MKARATYLAELISPRQRTVVNTPPDSTHVQIGKVGVRIQSKGTSGPTVLFLHGAGGVPSGTPFFGTLSQGRRLLAPDHPGFGASDDPDFLRDVPDLAMFYLDFLDTLDLREVHLVGHSLGAWIGAELAVRNQGRIKSLTLISAPGIRLKGSPMGDVFIWSHEEAVRNLYHDPQFAERQLAQPIDPERMDVLIKNRYAFAKLAWQPRGFNPALEKWLHRITVPTRVIWGRQDKVLPVAIATRWKELVPQARVDIIDSCGHLPIVEQAERTAELVAEHIEGALA
jgi:pimeloyl-ACP methyl ester carboxylesterase